MDSSILRQRAHEALKQKARRGELFTTVAIGYMRKGLDQIRKGSRPSSCKMRSL